MALLTTLPLLMLLQAATPLPAPSPSPSPSPEASPSPAPPGGPGGAGPGGAAGKRAAKDTEPHAIKLRADTQERLTKDHYRATGFVDLDTGDAHIQSDVADLYDVEKPEGGHGRHVVAEGNVVFLRGEERISADKVEMDLDSGHGLFTKAIGYVEPGVFVEADTIERLDSDHYRITGGKFTSCAQPNPRWRFSTSSAKVHLDDKVVAKNVVFRAKDVPVFYLPLFVYPIRDDQRATGLLLPHFGFSNVRGFLLGDGFFWAMGRSADQTFTVDRYSYLGWGYGHELRYALDAPSRALIKTYVFQPFDGGDVEYDLDWNAIQMLPGQVRSTLLVRQYSDILFQQRFQDSLTQASVRNARTVASLQRTYRSVTASLTADSVETFFGEESSRLNRHLPTFRLNRFARKVGHSPIVFGFDARTEKLELGSRIGDVELLDSYGRTDVAPDLSIPFGTTFINLTPRVVYRYTRYSDSYTTLPSGASTRQFSGEPLERQYTEGSLELRGPVFSRVFNNPSGFYGEKFKHEIGPEITYRYRSAIDDFQKIPKFDGTDQFLGTNQIDYYIVQKLLARRPGPTGKSAAYEFLTWRIGQTYYVQIKDSQNEFDPNYSSSIFGPGGVPDHNSPLKSNLRFRPTTAFTANFDVEYDVNFKQLRSLGLTGALNADRLSLLGGISRAEKLDVDPTKRVTQRDTLRTAASLHVLPDHLTLDGALDYDFVQKQKLRVMWGLHYSVQCCGLNAEYVEYDFNQRQEKIFRFSIELANIGSIGNFMGEPQGTPGGYR